jgi:hypothetical protein
MNEIEPRLPLESLDPETRDPGYWSRFHRSVMQAAGPRLSVRAARRPSFEDLLLSWGRLFVPATVAAAALAGLMILGDVEPEPALPPLVGLEEMLTPEWTDEELEPLPAHFFQGGDVDAVLFAANPF